MARSLEDGIELLTNSVREKIVGGLAPLVSRAVAALAELEAALGGAPARRGRKPGPKPGKRRGRKPGPKPATAAGRTRRRAKNAPRGALREVTLEILGKSSKPLRLTDLVNAIMKTEHFKGRNAKSIYNKVNADLSKDKAVSRVGKGMYALKK